jgi:hypothetical protein
MLSVFSSLQLEIFTLTAAHTHFDGQVSGPNLVGQLAVLTNSLQSSMFGTSLPVLGGYSENQDI